MQRADGAPTACVSLQALAGFAGARFKHVVVVALEINRPPFPFDAGAALPDLRAEREHATEQVLMIGILDLECDVIVGARRQRLSFHDRHP